MMPEGVALDISYGGQNWSQKGSVILWTNAKDIFVQSPVIFPRVHVARNIRRFNRNPFDLVAMSGEQSAQTAFGFERQQFITVLQID
jgi:hypothetical protein